LQDKYDAEIKKQDGSLLHTRIWKGQSNYGLENHCAAHRNAYVQLEAEAEHIEYQLPNEHSQVGYLIDSIQNNDPGLQAGLANIRSDKGAGGMRGNFEAVVAHILPYCPVSTKRTAGSKRGAADISSIVAFADGDTAEISSFGSKSGVGKYGVHLHFYKHKEYQTLNLEQKSELNEWREQEVAAGRGGKGGNSGAKAKGNSKTSDKHINSRIDAAVAKKLTAHAKPADNKKSDDAAVESYIISAFERMIRKKPTPQASTAKILASVANAHKTSILHNILKRAKNKPYDEE
jgi:hypothetical protein